MINVSIALHILVLSSIIASPSLLAKRKPPKEVPPVLYHDIKYIAPHWIEVEGEHRAGGYVEARDVKTGRRLWIVRVYEARYDAQLEKDVQDVFITSLTLRRGKLMVENERGERYLVDLKTRRLARG